MTEKECVICGKPFTPKNNTQECCSSICANKKSHETLKRYNHCVICGKPFWKPNAHRFKYCSDECRKVGFEQLHPKKEKPPKKVYHRECEWCGTPFETTIPNKKYCSEDCSYNGNLKMKREQWADAYIPNTHICRECGTEFTTECGNKHSVFCCQTCADSFKRHQEHDSEQHKRYMLASKRKREHLLIDNFVEEVTYSELYHRDGGICQVCGLPVHPEKLIDNSWDGTIDHIVPLSLGGEHSMRNCQLAHRICNSLKRQQAEAYKIDWEKKSQENNYWRIKYENYISLMCSDVSYGGRISGT